MARQEEEKRTRSLDSRSGIHPTVPRSGDTSQTNLTTTIGADPDGSSMETCAACKKASTSTRWHKLCFDEDSDDAWLCCFSLTDKAQTYYVIPPVPKSRGSRVIPKSKGAHSNLHLITYRYQSTHIDKKWRREILKEYFGKKTKDSRITELSADHKEALINKLADLTAWNSLPGVSLADPAET
jgi:hypothetical protein